MIKLFIVARFTKYFFFEGVFINMDEPWVARSMKPNIALMTIEERIISFEVVIQASKAARVEQKSGFFDLSALLPFDIFLKFFLTRDFN